MVEQLFTASVFAGRVLFLKGDPRRHSLEERGPRAGLAALVSSQSVIPAKAGIQDGRH